MLVPYILLSVYIFEACLSARRVMKSIEKKEKGKEEKKKKKKVGERWRRRKQGRVVARAER